MSQADKEYILIFVYTTAKEIWNTYDTYLFHV